MTGVWVAVVGVSVGDPVGAAGVLLGVPVGIFFGGMVRVQVMSVVRKVRVTAGVVRPSAIVRRAWMQRTRALLTVGVASNARITQSWSRPCRALRRGWWGSTGGLQRGGRWVPSCRCRLG